MHARRRVGVLQIVNQLLEVLDRIDVVVRWRTDQADARRRVPRLRNPGPDLVARELAALARLGSLRHLDLDVVRVGEVFSRDTESPGRDLFDRRSALRVVINSIATIPLPAFGDSVTFGVDNTHLFHLPLRTDVSTNGLIDWYFLDADGRAMDLPDNVPVSIEFELLVQNL